MIAQRSVGLSVILSIVTCGIYGIYWFIVLTNDVGTVNEDSNFTGGKHLLLSIVTCGIWSFVWSYQIGKQLQEAQWKRGFPSSDNAVLYLILNFFGLSIVTMALAQSDVNRFA